MLSALVFRIIELKTPFYSFLPGSSYLFVISCPSDKMIEQREALREQDLSMAQRSAAPIPLGKNSLDCVSLCPVLAQG